MPPSPSRPQPPPSSPRWKRASALPRRRAAAHTSETPVGASMTSCNQQGNSFIQTAVPGCHGLGVLAMAVSLTCLHGHPEDGKSVAPELNNCTALLQSRGPSIVQTVFAPQLVHKPTSIETSSKGDRIAEVGHSQPHHPCRTRSIHQSAVWSINVGADMAWGLEP